MSDIQNPQPGAQNIRDFSEHRIRGARTGELVTSHVHGKYEEVVRGGRVFVVSTPVAGITVTANMLYSVASANAILGLYNPTSDQYLHVLRTQVATATVTACNLVWAVISPLQVAVNPTGVSARNPRDLTKGGHKAIAFDGSVACSGLGVTAFYRMLLPALPTGIGRVALTEDDEEILIPPYGFAGVFGDTTTAATVVFGSLMWEEVPV